MVPPGNRRKRAAAVATAVDAVAALGDFPGMRRLYVLGLLLLVVACGRRSSAPAVSKEKLDAFRRCNEASARLDDPVDPGEEIGSRSAELSRACADIYSEPGCADVWRHPSPRLEERASAMAKACRDAYCPKLPEPRPALCATKELPLPTEMARQWRELQSRIIARELGIAPEIVEALSPVKHVTVRKRLTMPPEPEKPPLVVKVANEGRGVRVSINGVKESVLFDPRGKDDALAAMVRRAKAKGPAGTGVVLGAGSTVAYDTVIRVLDVLKNEGFPDVSFEAGP